MRLPAAGQLVTVLDPISAHTVQSLYVHHHGWLRGWLQRKLGDACEAADLAHDTFVRLMGSRRLSALNDEPRALITHIAKGLLVDHWRRRQVQQAYLETLAHLPEPQAPSPETELIVVETLLRIDAMLRGLPARTRQAFLMAQLDGLTLQQIADQTGSTLITVRRDIQRALVGCMALAD